MKFVPIIYKLFLSVSSGVLFLYTVIFFYMSTVSIQRRLNDVQQQAKHPFKSSIDFELMEHDQLNISVLEYQWQQSPPSPLEIDLVNQQLEYINNQINESLISVPTVPGGEVARRRTFVHHTVVSPHKIQLHHP